MYLRIVMMTLSIYQSCSFISYLRLWACLFEVHILLHPSRFLRLVSCLRVIEHGAVGPLATSVNIVENRFPAQHQSVQPGPCLNGGRCSPLVASSSLIVAWWRTVDTFHSPFLSSSCPLFALWLSFTSRVL